MTEPGLDRHEWESELASLEDDLRDHPAAALPELDGVVHKMLEEAGYDLGDPVASEGAEHEIVVEFLAARQIKEAYERGTGDLSPGDIAAAINGYRAVFDHIVTSRAASDADLPLAGEAEE